MRISDWSSDVCSSDLDPGDATILVVEDSTEVRRVAVNHLTAFGYQVVEAASGREALNQLAADDSIALLFTDVIMPGGLSGPELRSAERRGGKACGSTCRSRWSPYH